MNNEKPNILLLIIAIYVLAQLIWWGYIIFDLQNQVFTDGILAQKTLMIAGEGIVFIALFIMAFIQLNKTHKQELQLAQQQQNFILSITHELKTPLTALRLSLQTLKRNNKDDNELIQLALDEETRLESFVEDLLTIKSLDKKEWVASFTKFETQAFVEGICEQLKKNYPLQNIVLDIKTEETLSDKIALRIILFNLIDNALKYSPENSTISIINHSKNGNNIFEIKDNAPNIPYNEQQKIFNKFYRFNTNSLNTGNGLGLYLVKNFVDALKGKIQLSNNATGGNSFKIILP